ncbi:MAG: hypoxanthine phosphoribosyltransferase [Candidatus Dadabacteria bacterium]|nr:hypoxanthine phosphoribosyltransferase [Candidatus Dadabacteria bacterium]
MGGKNPRLIISADEIRARVRELGRELTAAYEGKNPVLVGILKGSFIFLADLAREMDCEAEIDFVHTSSYREGMSPGELELLTGPTIQLSGRHVVLVEDLLDTGITCSFVQDLILSKNPASFALCALVDKKERREVPIEADYVGFTLERGFVVGYGTDYAEAGRNLPGIYVLE